MSVDDDVKRKLDQAEFHLERLRSAESLLAAESHFSAFIAAARSITMYVHEWQVANNRAASARDWSRINAWERTLPATELDAWRTVVALRNTDIHEHPVLPTVTWKDDPHWGPHFPSEHWGPLFGAVRAHVVEHPATGHTAELVELAENAIKVMRRLLVAYRSL